MQNYASVVSAVARVCLKVVKVKAYCALLVAHGGVNLFVLLPLAIVSQAWVVQSAALRQAGVVHTSVASNRGGLFRSTQLNHCDSLIYPLQVGWKHIRTTSFLANSPTVAVFHALGNLRVRGNAAEAKHSECRTAS